MKKIKKLLKLGLCLSLVFALALSLGAAARADGIRFGVGGGSGDVNVSYDSNGLPRLRESASKAKRAEDCQKLLNSWWQDKMYKWEYELDDFASVDTYAYKIRQIDILSHQRSDSRNSSYYSPLNDYTVGYYYHNGLPYFAFVYDDNTSNNKETRLYISEGEVVSWKNSYGEEGFGEPAEFDFIYEHAMSAYARAMCDYADKGTFAIDMGTFKDSGAALACRQSLLDLGINARIEVIDNIYCVLVGRYNTWDAAAEDAEMLHMTDECGIMFIRCL